ncbi:MAG: O-antigen ligase family protein [Gemmatales bacterium]
MIKNSSSQLSSARGVPSRFTFESILDGAMEGIILLILVVTPWLLGGTQANHIQLAGCGIALVLLLWAIKQVVRWKLTLHFCWVSLTLVLLFLISCLYLLPMHRTTLRYISPEAVKLYDALLPAQQEQSMMGGDEENLPFPLGSTVSLYPGATQLSLLQLLAVMALFFVVRHNLATPERLKRLAWVMVANGCIMSIFALVQKMRGLDNVIYGFQVPGVAFGTFINRNHFSSYVNFCIFLGLGLFLSTLQRASGSYAVSDIGQKMPVRYSVSLWSEILQHPQAMWLLIPITVCITAVLASLSRGGILALGVGLVLAILAWQRKGGARGIWWFLAIPAVAFVLLMWYGATPTVQRLENDLLTQDGRFTIWKASYEAFKQFPITGTGFGTFQTVEPLYRPLGAEQTTTHTHAHSEYVEALVEGGLIRFLLTLVLIWLVLRSGWQALQTRRRGSRQALILGAWAACLTLAVQSIGKFGIHVPAVAAILAVTAGYLVGLGGNRDNVAEENTLIDWHYFGIGPLMGLVFAVTIGFILFAGLWLNWQFDGYRLDGLHIRQNAKGDPALLQKAVDRLDTAIALEPAYSRVRMERYEIEKQRLMAVEAQDRSVNDRCLCLQKVVRVNAGLMGLQNNPLSTLAEDVLQPYLAQALLSKRLRDRQADSWKTQQRHLRAARNLSPLAWNPHLEISMHVLPKRTLLPAEDRWFYWKTSEELTAYLNRIKLLHPHRAETWYQCGQQEWLNGMRDTAIASWRRSLELSDEFLGAIVLETAQSVLQSDFKLTTPEIMEKLLPRQSARQHVKAAWVLYPRVAQTVERKPFLEKALEILEKRPDLTSPENQYDYGLAMWGIDKREQAAQHLSVAVLARPDQTEWRLDLGRLYYELEKYADAREHLQLVLRAQPGNLEAIALLDKLDKLQRPSKE